MNEQAYEQEISLGRIFYRIFRDWRKICLAAVVIALLAGVGNFSLKKIRNTNPEYLRKAEENFERELAGFRATGETLRREIANLEETRAEREAYNADSILMKINPYREFNASLQIYIATDYQIVPELTYQNIDLSNRILQSYLTYMVNGDMYQYILDHLSQPVELRYLKEILSITPDYDNRMISLNVQNVDEEGCEEILTLAQEGILAKQPGIVKAIGEHELNTVNQSVYESVNLELDEWQKANIQYVSELSIRLQEKGEEYAKWERSPEPQKEYTAASILRNSIKTMILGFLAGAVLAAIFIAFCYIMSDKLQDADNLKNRYGLRVVAQVPKVHKKRVWVGFDRLFACMGGLPLYERDAAALAKVAAQSVMAELMAMGTLKGGTIAFTGNVALEEMKKLIAEMEWGDSCTVKCVPNILNNPSAVPEIMNAEYIVLIEKQEESSYTQITRELSELAAWKKKVLGFVVVGVDAIP